MAQRKESRIYEVPSEMTNQEIAAILSVFGEVTVGGGTFLDPFGNLIAARQDDEHISIHEYNCDEEVIMTAKVQFNRLSDEENKKYMDSST
jgi:hypothetical protein